jgi:hypothetical protein
MKLYFASPVHLAAGAGSPAGSRGAKSKAADVMNGVSHFLGWPDHRQICRICRQPDAPASDVLPCVLTLARVQKSG